MFIFNNTASELNTWTYALSVSLEDGSTTDLTYNSYFSQSFTFDWLCKFLCWPSHFSSHPFPTHTYPSSILVINLLYICFIHRPIQKWGFLSLSLAKDDINHTLTSAKDCAAAMRGIHGQQANIGGICKAWPWLWAVRLVMKPWTFDGENQYYLLSVFLSSSLSRKATKSV